MREHRVIAQELFPESISIPEAVKQRLWLWKCVRA